MLVRSFSFIACHLFFSESFVPVIYENAVNRLTSTLGDVGKYIPLMISSRPASHAHEFDEAETKKAEANEMIHFTIT